MTRKEWQRKSAVFAQSAKALLEVGQHDSAYYLAGLAMECALKAKIATRFRANDIPAKNVVLEIYNNGHNLTKLIALANLETALSAEERANAIFRASWNTAKTWTVDSRYVTWSPAEASDMVSAVTKRGTGVLAWIRQHW